MEKKEKDIADKNQKDKNGEINSSDIENAHATGDGSLGRDEETLIAKSTEDKKDAIKKDAEKY
ncbi:MAG TPA: hypothetical protein VNA26_07175 [Chitinophagaceae bacterium]|nr:hypothetical protein [Chitinophagaceae bacterium]